ncbi:MAG: 5-formyltetrahydrofolate cyclo-ligase [Verrucomicrobiales bacterium]
MTPPPSQPDLRRTVLAAVRAIPPAERAARSRRIAAHLGELLPGLIGGTRDPLVLSFCPMPDEPDLAGPFAAASACGARLAFPRIAEGGAGRMEFFAAGSWQGFLQRRKPAIREPDPAAHPRVDPALAAAVLVPGVAFDPGNGMRLGRGGGFYDRLLAAIEPAVPRIGIAFGAQIVPDLPHRAHDCRVGWIVTEGGIMAA